MIDKYQFIYNYGVPYKFIIDNLPIMYKKRWWGEKTIYDVILNFGFKGDNFSYDAIRSGFGSDKFIIQDYNLNNYKRSMLLTGQRGQRSRKYFALFVDPMERIGTICEDKGWTVDELIFYLENEEDSYLHQHKKLEMEGGGLYNITVMLPNKKNHVKHWWEKVGIIIPEYELEEPSNIIKTITKKQRNKLKNLYHRDYIIYKQLLENNGVIHLRDGIDIGPHHGVLYTKSAVKPLENPVHVDTTSKFDEKEVEEWIKIHYGKSKEIMRRFNKHLEDKHHHYIDTMFIILYLKKNGGWYDNNYYHPHSTEINNKLSTLLNRPMNHGKSFNQL